MKVLDLSFKVRIKSENERSKVVKHLQELGLYYPNDDFDKIYGILVGNAYIGEVFQKSTFTNNPKQELTVNEVLKLNKQDYGK